MRCREILDQALTDLARYAKGARRSLQRKYRMIFFLARENSLGRRAEIGQTFEEVEAWALALMRQEHPGFSPEMA
jgi:hypothetical protein